MAPRVEIAPVLDAQENMSRDYERLMNLKPEDTPLLSFYRWKRPSLTYGYFAKPEEWVDVKTLEERGYSLGKRPTGGGIIFHTHDLAFSILIPKGHPRLSENTLDNYRLINGLVKEAVANSLEHEPMFLPESYGEASFCMAGPTIYDVMLGNKKIGGAAQRRNRQGLLHQGSISLGLPSREELSELIIDPLMVDRILETTCPLKISSERLREDLESAFLTLLSI